MSSKCNWIVTNFDANHIGKHVCQRYRKKSWATVGVDKVELWWEEIWRKLRADVIDQRGQYRRIVLKKRACWNGWATTWPEARSRWLPAVNSNVFPTTSLTVALWSVTQTWSGTTPFSVAIPSPGSTSIRTDGLRNNRAFVGKESRSKRVAPRL